MSDTPVDLKAKEAEATAQNNADEKQHTAVDLSRFMEPSNSEQPVRTFAIEMHNRNTADNPDRENTNTMPVLVRRVNSEELLPRPFKTTTQLVCLSYLSAVCCLFFGAFAVYHAWEAKQKRNAGVLSGAVKEGKRSCCWMKVALGVGIPMWIWLMVLLVMYLVEGDIIF